MKSSKDDVQAARDWLFSIRGRADAKFVIPGDMGTTIEHALNALEEALAIDEAEMDVLRKWLVERTAERDKLAATLARVETVRRGHREYERATKQAVPGLPALERALDGE